MEYYSSLDASKLDSETPTLFELISAHQLESLLSPSLRYILVHYAQRYPTYLLKITNKFDEINLFLRTLIEWYFFKHWRGSFTENFYGIKRVSQTPLSNKKYNTSKVAQLAPSIVEERRRLSPLQTAVSIFEITGVSYLSEKLNYQYELLYSKFITNQLDDSLATSSSEARKVKLQIMFVKIYPYIQAIWRFSNLLTTLSYLSGATKSASVLTLLFKIHYARLNQYDYTRNETSLPSQTNKFNRVNPPSTYEQFLRNTKKFFARPLVESLRFALGTFFPLAIFSLKFLEWYNSSSFAQTVAKSQRNALEDSIPPPSVIRQVQDIEKGSKKLYKSGNTCPLCKEEISNPAIIETGYVFCYTCIYNYLRDSRKLVAAKMQLESDSESDDVDSDTTEDQLEAGEKPVPSAPRSEELKYVEKGGRCPITGQKLLGCKWNDITGEYDVDGIRRLIF